MNKIISIADYTLKETFRNKIILGILGIGILYLGSTIFVSSLSMGEDLKVAKDLGLAGIYLISLIITIFLGASLIHKEVESQTAHTIFSKPISKNQFILGKFFGLLVSMAIMVLILTVFYLLIVFYKGGGFDAVSLLSIFLMFFEVALFIALSILFSSITAPLNSTIYSVIILFIGHNLVLLKNEADKAGGFLKAIGNFVYYALPNLEKFNLRNLVIYGNIPSFSEILLPIFYATFLIIIILWLAIIALGKQEI